MGSFLTGGDCQRPSRPKSERHWHSKHSHANRLPRRKPVAGPPPAAAKPTAVAGGPLAVPERAT
jgi:hypothetical protein